MRARRVRLTVVAVATATAALVLGGAVASAAPTKPTPTNAKAASTASPHGGTSTVPKPPAKRTTIAGAAASTTTSPAPPAPSDFKQQLLDIYQETLTVAGKYPAPPSGEALPSYSAFQQQVDQLSQDDLNTIYSADPGQWDEIQTALTTLSGSGPAPVQQNTPSKSGSSGTKSNGSSSPAPNKKPSAQTKLNQANDVTIPQIPDPPQLNSCGAADLQTVLGIQSAYIALQGAAYALQISIDGLTIAQAFNTRDVTFGTIVAGEGAVITIPNPAWGVLEDIKTGLSTTMDALNFAAAEASNSESIINICAGFNTADEVDYITAVVQLLGQMDQNSLTNEANISASIASGFNETDQRLSNLQTSVNTAQTSLDTALTERIESALVGGTATPITDFELPASAGGYLDATPIGVKVIVTNALTVMQQNGQAVASNAKNYLTLANNYLNGKKYKQAWKEYQLAYAAIAK